MTQRGQFRMAFDTHKISYALAPIIHETQGIRSYTRSDDNAHLGAAEGGLPVSH
jgi:hypothetical protein